MAEHDASAASVAELWPALTAVLPEVICTHCGATMADYAEKCQRSLTEVCHGFLSIEGARQHLRLTGEAANG